jgi:hypothetical protein
MENKKMDEVFDRELADVKKFFSSSKELLDKNPNMETKIERTFFMDGVVFSFSVRRMRAKRE